jgi:tetratricopeptide (TPR) repeat protein
MAGDFIGAAEDADAAIQRDPRNGDAYLHGALALLPLQRISEALSLLTIGITKAPPHPGLRCMRGSILRQIGRIVDALADINEAIRIQPQNAGAYAERSYIYAARTDWYRAATDAVEAARLAPTPGHLYYAGFTLCQQNRWAEAIPYLDGALKADPNHADARIERERIRHRIRI